MMQHHERIPVEALLTRAAKDLSFRQELVSEPKIVLQRDFGVSFSETCRVRVLEESDDAVYVLIPRTMVLSGQEEDVATNIVSRAVRDPEYKARLMAEPRQVLEAELGVSFPEGVEIRVLADSEDEMHLILPSMFQAGVLVDEVRIAGWGPSPTEGGSSCTQCGNSLCTIGCTTSDVPNCPGGPSEPLPS